MLGHQTPFVYRSQYSKYGSQGRDNLEGRVQTGGLPGDQRPGFTAQLSHNGGEAQAGLVRLHVIPQAQLAEEAPGQHHL
eukprot:scaffold680956_cov47-Prasinocladus_malaysianus.AAC.1